MAGYVPGEQLSGKQIVKLNTNENPYPASEGVSQAIRAQLTDGLARYPNALADPFREKAGEVLGFPPDWILCGNGSDDILTICTRALVGTGELLRLPYPSYILYKTLAQIQGARSEEVHFAKDWLLSDDFARATEGLRLAFLPNPNSPSGTVIPPEEVLALAERLPCPLLVDEAYADFADTNCLDLVRENEKILISRTLSKSYALTGLRFGFLIAQPQIIDQLMKVKDSYNCDTLSIVGATAAMADTDWLRENCEKVIATRERMTLEMRRLGFEVVDSQTNFTWNTHPEVPLKPIYEGLRSDGILVRYMDYPDWGDGIRISVGTDEQVDRLLRKVAEIL